MTGLSWAQIDRTPRKQSPPAPGATPYHVRVVVTHVDPLASREPGLILKHLLHKAQVARIGVMEQAVGGGQSAPLLIRTPTWANLPAGASPQATVR